MKEEKPCFYCKKLHETDSTGVSICDECKKCSCGYTEARGELCKFCPPKSSIKIREKI